jgi:hypothetical protein
MVCIQSLTKAPLFFVKPPEMECAAKVASLFGESVHGERAIDIPLLLEKVSQNLPVDGLATLFRPPKGSEGKKCIASLQQQAAKVESARRVAALVRPGIGRERAVEIALLLEECADIGSTRRIAPLVRTPEGG